MSQSRITSGKAAVLQILQNRDWESLTAWTQNERSAIRVLSSLILSVDPLIRWRAIEALGKFCGIKAKNDLRQVKAIIRRMLWGMNDESGNLIWSAPEAIAEILFNVPQLIEEYSKILPSFIDLEPFQRGVHWGLTRLSPVAPQLFIETAPLLRESLKNEDPAIRVYACFALSRIQPDSLKEHTDRLCQDTTKFEMYDIEQGTLLTTTVAEQCKAALFQ